MGRIYQLFKTHRLQSIYFGILIAALSVFSTLLLLPKPVSAAEPKTATGKALVWGIQSCFKSYGLNKTIYIQNGTKNGGADQIFPHGKINVPTKYGNTASSSTVSCAEALVGGSGFQGLLGRSNINLNDSKTRDDFYKSLGYKKDRDGNYQLKNSKTQSQIIATITKKSVGDFNTNDLERVKMYSFMLTNVYKVKPDNCSGSKVTNSVAVIKNGKIQYCKVPPVPPVQPQVGNLQNGKIEIRAFHKTKNSVDNFSYKQLISALNSTAVKLDEKDLKTIDDSTNFLSTGGDSDGATDMEACFNNAGAFGWVMCPLISGLHNIAEKLYQKVESWLGVHPSIVASIRPGSSSDVFKLWSKFRDIANITFVIVFLVVILSQVSGLGISNYNVKKMLPKLVVTAILVNVSFIICALAVDVSNIVGSSTKRLLTGMGENIAAKCVLGENASACSSTEIAGNIITTVMAGAGVGIAAIKGAVVFSVTGWALLGPILIFLLTFVIATFFAFVILGVRQALVVILIAISPIAFVLNILPNTEGIFKKWQKLFSGILLMFPICGLLIGGGYVASRLLLSVASVTSDTTNVNESNGVPVLLNLLISGTILVAPYFFIPNLVTRTLDNIGKLAGIGAIGSRLGRLSTSAQNRASSSAKATNAYKDSMANMKSSLQKHYDDKTIKKLSDKTNLSAAERSRLTAATKRSEALENQKQEDYANMFGNGLSNVYDANGEAIIEDATSNADIMKAAEYLALKQNRTEEETMQLLALNDLAIRRGGLDEVSSMVENHSDQFSTETRQAIAQNLTGKWLKDVKSGDPKLFEWSIGAQSTKSNEEIQAEIATLEQQYNNAAEGTSEKEKAFKALRSARSKLDMNYATSSKVMSKATGSTLNGMENAGLESLARDLTVDQEHSIYTKAEMNAMADQLYNIMQVNNSGAQQLNGRVLSKLYTDDVKRMIEANRTKPPQP